MRLAIIDLGTNSVRFDLQEIGPGTQIKRLDREKIMVRMGQGVFTDGHLNREAVRRTLHAFLRFRRVANNHGAEKTIAFATSALREARDKDKFLQTIFKRTGIDVRVISGAEEANLIARGILANEKLPKGKYALVDIGGGSTEISICSKREVLFSHSFPLGTARLQQLFLKRSPPTADSVRELRRYIRDLVYQTTIGKKWPKVKTIIGSSGTVRALTKIIKRQKGKANIPHKDLENLVDQMSTMTTTQLLGIRGIEPKRVDMILAGALLLEECMRVLGAKTVIPTEYSLRDGILDEEVQLFRQHKSSHLVFHLPQVFEIAQRFGGESAQLKSLTHAAIVLFDRTKSIHRLKPQWKLYLIAATALRDAGLKISQTRSEMHSYYIVKNTDLAALEKWESEFVAQLCLHHKSQKLTNKKLPFRHNREKREAFFKTLALLQLVDALDVGPEGQIDVKSIRISRTAVTISISGKKSTGLESFYLERGQRLFRKLFKRKVMLKIA